MNTKITTMEKRIRKMRILLNTLLFISMAFAWVGLPYYAVYSIEQGMEFRQG